jgi:hypothetical protein
VRDGALTEVMQAYSGNVEPLVRWTEFLLANPTRISDEQPQGTMFGQLVNKITKWQEDGCFYAVWSVFSAWTQTGDDAFVAPRYQKVLHASLSWLEQYCFDAERGLFGRYFANETPFSGAHDEGYDGAVGAPGDPSWLERGWEKLKIIYDLELNLCMYSVYSMLAAMTTGKKAAEQLEAKAQALAVELEQYFEEADEAGMPTYGHLILHSGTELVEPPYSLDYADYVYSFALPPFTPFTLRNKRILTAIVRDSLDNKRRGFLGAYYAVFAKADPLWIDERDIVAAFEQGAAVSIPPGGVLPMPYAAIENFDRTDGDVIRPQAFTIGPWLAALTGVGLRRLPFGIALRPTTLLASLSAYRYRHALLDVVFSGKGRWCSVSLNGKELEGTLQLPEKKLRRGKNRVAVVATEAQAKGPTLIGSTVRLLSVQRFGTGGFTYALECYGRNVVEFVGAVGCSIQVVDENDRAVEHIVSRDEQLQVVEFGGRGGRWVIVEQGDEQQ